MTDTMDSRVSADASSAHPEDLEMDVEAGSLRLASNGTDGRLSIEDAGSDGEEGNFTTDDQVVGAGGHNLGGRTRSELHFSENLAPLRKEAKKYSIRQTLLLAYQTLGVVYGDLGTSPLYVFSSTQLKDPVTEKDLLGVMSIMFWTLTLIALIKYVFIVLRADDHGEGGTAAVYSKLCQHARIGQTAGRSYKPLQSDTQLQYFSRNNKGIHSRTIKFLERSKKAQSALLIVVMIGTSMVIGDGVLTPAISVLSAMVGIQQAKGSHINDATVVAISAIILLLVFMLQRFGTSKVAFLFSPVMVLWFAFTPIIGVYNIVKFYPGVFKALSPHYIYLFFQKNKVHGWEALSGIILVITGAEAMFADLGHFNHRAIQLAFSCFVYPSLILTYLGQTAFLIHDPSKLGTTFFASIPETVYWPMFVVSTLAAIVASQALISATFSIVKQAVALGSFPRVKISHTSEEEVGQVYSPAANYILMILCLAVVLGFRNGTQIGNAFGVAVIFVMAITTCLVTLVMLVIWETAWPLILLFFVTFISIEGVYITAVLKKIPQGGWVPFAIAILLLLVMLTWNIGRRAKQAYEAQNRLSPDSLQELLESSDLRRVPGICFFFSDLSDGPPPVFTHYVKNVRSLHQTLVFTTVRFVPVKTVLPSERFLVGRVGSGHKGVYRCIARYGYKDFVNVKEQGFMQQVVASLNDYLEAKKLSAEEYAKCVDADARSQFLKTIPEEIQRLQDELKNGEVYVIGKAKVELTKEAGWFHRFVVNKLFYLLQTNCRSGIADLQIPALNLLEVGMVYSCKGD